jgi:hypothetical protein
LHTACMNPSWNMWRPGECGCCWLLLSCGDEICDAQRMASEGLVRQIVAAADLWHKNQTGTQLTVHCVLAGVRWVRAERLDSVHAGASCHLPLLLAVRTPVT